MSLSAYFHGSEPRAVHRSWRAMRARCYNQKHKSFKYYGARGITVCAEWRQSFVVFRDWALANGYADGLTLERNDTNADYQPANCTWTTPLRQANNRRSCVYLAIDGVTKSIADHCRDHGVSPSTVEGRVRRGMSGSALFIVDRPNLSRETISQIRAASGSQHQIAAQFGISRSYARDIRAGKRCPL